MTTRVKHHLVEFLLAEDGRAAVSARLLSEAGLWNEALALARTWKVTPQLSARIQGLRVELTPADMGTLRREFVQVYGQSAMRAAKAITAIRSMQEAGIPVAAFKGIASMAVLYGDPKHRTIHDADVLILQKDLPRTLACLESVGFTRQGSETLAEYLNFAENSPGLAGNKEVAVFGRDGGEIDLHWELEGSGLAVDGILERAGTAPLLNATIPVVDSKDGFLLTVRHAIREDLAIDGACRDLFDVRLWCHHLRENGQLNAAMQWAADSGCQVSALAVTSVLSGFDDSTAAAQAAMLLRALASPAERKSAARLVELFYYQLGNGRVANDVFYLVHSRPLRQILKGLGTNWSGYRRSMQTFDKQVGQEMPLHERVAQLARSIPGPRGLKLARELARFKYAASRKK